jgi:hypothetical protein
MLLVYGWVKATVNARAGVGVVEAISTSMRFETKAGIRSGDGVSTISGSAPSALAMSLQ